MSFANPTHLRIGMHGDFAGKDFRLIGRVVMGVEEDGETYYWNEFNLETKSGESATLVYEEGEHGGEWRMFTLFDPEYPMTAADAATKHVGDGLNLTGTDVRVTLKDTSRVYRIEGKAPEGVEVGDVAHYFNAEARGIMQVVSWTGDEVEFYNGVNLSRESVMSAFGLPAEPKGLSALGKNFSGDADSADYTSTLKFILQIAAVIFVFYVVFGRSLSCSRTYESAPVKKIMAGDPPLTVGATGTLKDKHYHITAHAVVEIDEVGSACERHEYQLTDDDGKTDLLVCGLQAKDKKWTLFRPLDPLLPPRPQDCAAQKVGDIVNVAGVVGPVREIFLSTVRQSDGAKTDGWPDVNEGFGYLAQSEYDFLLVRWNNHTINFQRGLTVPAETTLAAFANSPGK